MTMTGTITGMHRDHGRAVSGLDHLRQSIRDILTTPIGSRVMRRDYGSGLFKLIDRPLDGVTIAAIYAATADALRKWEPRLRVRRIQAQADPGETASGRLVVTLEGEVLPDGAPVRLEGIPL